MKKVTVVLCLMMMAGPAWAWELTPAEKEYVLQREIEGEYIPPGDRVIKGGRAPTQTQMELYVPLTAAQQELPTMGVDPGVDYVPGIEAPAGGQWPKQINDRVLPPIRPYNPPGLAVYDETPMVTNPGVLPPLRPVYPPQ